MAFKMKYSKNSPFDFGNSPMKETWREWAANKAAAVGKRVKSAYEDFRNTGDDPKRIHQTGVDPEKYGLKSLERFTKGARTETGTYGPDDVTKERGKRTFYSDSSESGPTKTVQIKKKGSKSGDEGWETRRKVSLTPEQYKRQIERKKKRFKNIDPS